MKKAVGFTLVIMWSRLLVALLSPSMLLAVSTRFITIDREATASRVASPTEDPILGFDVVFPPVPSCLSSVILVIYVQFLDMLERLNEYTEMYGPHVAGIEYYVDGTWCDPRQTPDGGLPCYGEALNRSLVPDGVRVIDRNGGGWMMQRSLVDAVSRPRGSRNVPVGFLFIVDDVLVNLGQLSRTVNVSGCGFIWRSATMLCQDVNGEGPKTRVFGRFLKQAQDFYEVSDDNFRTQLTRNLGSPSMYCMGTQNDFLYMPTTFAEDWARVATQMTDTGLPFTFAFGTAIFGIARMKDMMVLRTHYLEKSERADVVLQDASLDETSETLCWRGRDGGVAELLASHIIHPHKLHHSQAEWDFARTLCQWAVTLDDANRHRGMVVENDSSTTTGLPFWCPT